MPTGGVVALDIAEASSDLIAELADPTIAVRRRAFTDRNTWQIRARCLLEELAMATSAASSSR